MGKYRFRLNVLDVLCYLYPNDPIDAHIQDDFCDYDKMEWKCNLPKPTEEELYEAELACMKCRLMEQFREWRNKELKETDAKMMVIDYPISEEEKEGTKKYRQLLRDAPKWIMLRYKDEELTELDIEDAKFQIELKTK